MKIRILVRCVVMMLLFAGTAHAAKLLVQVSSKDAPENGFSVTAKPVKEGLVEYTIVRDLSKARAFPEDSPLEIRRYATLEVYGDAGLIARCNVEGDKTGTALTYSFTLARKEISHSTFTVAEVDDYKHPNNGIHLLGGGTFYDFSLADFPVSE